MDLLEADGRIVNLFTLPNGIITLTNLRDCHQCYDHTISGPHWSTGSSEHHCRAGLLSATSHPLSHRVP